MIIVCYDLYNHKYLLNWVQIFSAEKLKIIVALHDSFAVLHSNCAYHLSKTLAVLFIFTITVSCFYQTNERCGNFGSALTEQSPPQTCNELLTNTWL